MVVKGKGSEVLSLDSCAGQFFPSYLSVKKNMGNHRIIESWSHRIIKVRKDFQDVQVSFLSEHHHSN